MVRAALGQVLSLSALPCCKSVMSTALTFTVLPSQSALSATRAHTVTAGTFCFSCAFGAQAKRPESKATGTSNCKLIASMVQSNTISELILELRFQLPHQRPSHFCNETTAYY